MREHSVYQKLLKSILELMVCNPSRIVVRQVDTSRKVILGVQCHPDDYSYIIGREAHSIRALQSIFRQVGKHNDENIIITVQDNGFKETNSPTIPMDPDWNRDKEMGNLMGDIMALMGHKNGPVTTESIGNKTILKAFAKPPMPVNLVESIATTFRSIGRINGRLIEIDVQ